MKPQSSRRIDTKLAPVLFGLFGAGATEEPPLDSLARRNLLRGVTLGLPSYESVRRAMSGALAEHPNRLQIAAGPEFDLGLAAFGWNGETPLWFGILKEAEHHADGGGSGLGPVGARIVAEVLFGLLEGDPSSFIRAYGPRSMPTVACGARQATAGSTREHALERLPLLRCRS